MDLQTSRSAVRPDALSRHEHGRIERGVVQKRRGDRKVWRASDPGGSVAFIGGSAYGYVESSSAPAIPYGGFAVRWIATCTRPSSGNTAWMWSSTISLANGSVLGARLSDAGVLTVSWRDTAGTTHTATSAAISAGATVGVVALYDAVRGTYGLWIDGEPSGTGETGLASDLRPAQNAIRWMWGHLWDPGAGPAAIVASTNFTGAMDGWALLALRGLGAQDGSPTFLDMLRRTTWQEWPWPGGDLTLMCFDWNGATATAAADRSRARRTMVLASPTLGASIAHRAEQFNLVKCRSAGDGTRTNFVAVGGELYTESMR